MSNFTWHGEEVIRNVRAARERALKAGGEFILQEANRSVPIEERTLERSGATDVDGQLGVVRIGYNTPYAVRQHEDTTLRHDEGRTAKWLENAMKEQGTIAFGVMRRVMAGSL